MNSLKEVGEKQLIEKIKNIQNKNLIPRRYVLSEKIIHEYADRFQWWKDIIIYQPLSEKQIMQYQNKLISNNPYEPKYWELVFTYQNMTEEFMLKHKEKASYRFWSFISKNSHITDEFIEKYKSDISWYYLSIYRKLSEEFILKYTDYVDWYHVAWKQQLSEEFVLLNQNKIPWSAFFRNKWVAKDFYERNKHLMKKVLAKDLRQIIKTQTLTQETIEKMKKGKVVWKALSGYSDMDREFVIQNYDLLNKKDMICYNKKLKKKVKQEVEVIEVLSGNTWEKR